RISLHERRDAPYHPAPDWEEDMEVFETAGPLWIVAVAGMFFSAVCESAKPKAEDGERPSGGLGLVVAGLASLVTPILLFFFGFWSLAGGAGVGSDRLISSAFDRPVLVGILFAMLAGIAIAGSIVGWIIRAAAPALGKTLNRAAVALALATLALTIFVSYQAVTSMFAVAG
ncbi:MAG: hypothetical protein ABL932_04045, partial [Terricaulis sp.]